MILDQTILKLVKITDRDLELFSQKIALQTQNISIENNEQYEKIELLQNILQKIKVISDAFYNNVSNISDINHIEKIDSISLLNLVDQLPKEPFDYFMVTDNEFPNIVDQSYIEKFLKNIITRYIFILCYYNIIMETLVRIPQAIDTEIYFTSIEGSLTNKIIYSLQTSINKMIDMITLINEKFKFFVRNSSIKIMDSTQNSINMARKSIPEFTEYYYHNEFQPILNKIRRLQKFDFIGLPKEHDTLQNPIRFILGLPGFLINNEIQIKTKYISEANDNTLIKFGALIQSFSNSFIHEELKECFDILKKYLEEFTQDKDKIHNLFDIVLATHMFTNEINQIQLITSEKPNFIVRYWPVGLITILNGPSIVSLIWESRFNILDFVDENVIEFLKGLVYNWIWIPIKGIWATVRHDEGSEIAMMSHATLDSEMDSLCRMVVEVIKDNDPTYFNIINETILIDQIKHGNLNEFMKLYENELNYPIKNIFTGKLIRSILIQVQKTKVDGSLALNGIDKMLKSQQLVFSIMALSPATLIIYFSIKLLTNFIKLNSIWSNVKKYKTKISNNLNNIERLLNYKDFEVNDIPLRNKNHALLIMEISNLYSNGSKVIPKKRKSEWNRDVEELINIRFSNDAKLNVVNRIYHVYSYYFEF